MVNSAGPVMVWSYQYLEAGPLLHVIHVC